MRRRSITRRSGSSNPNANAHRRVTRDVLQVEDLFETALVSIRRARHPVGFAPRSNEETESAYGACIIDSGSVSLAAGKKAWTLREGDVLVARPGATYRYSHLDGVEPDVCLCIRLPHGFDEECEREFRFPDVVPRRTNRLAFLHHRLRAMVDDGDGLAADCWATDLVAALAAANADGDRPYRSAQLRWYAERVEAARATLSDRSSEQHSLAALAADAGMSPFQFARVFRQLVSVPPHRYLLEVRLTRAHAMLLDGVSVTDTCYDAGFSNLSHFIRMFGRRFGCTPSAVRRRFGPLHKNDGGENRCRRREDARRDRLTGD